MMTTKTNPQKFEYKKNQVIIQYFKLLGITTLAIISS